MRARRHARLCVRERDGDMGAGGGSFLALRHSNRIVRAERLEEGVLFCAQEGEDSLEITFTTLEATGLCVDGRLDPAVQLSAREGGAVYSIATYLGLNQSERPALPTKALDFWRMLLYWLQSSSGGAEG